MTRAEIQAHLKRANVHGEWEDVLIKDLCTALLESMDRVEELEFGLAAAVQIAGEAADPTFMPSPPKAGE
jgi:hypothetical protein